MILISPMNVWSKASARWGGIQMRFDSVVVCLVCFKVAIFQGMVRWRSSPLSSEGNLQVCCCCFLE